MNDVPMSRKEMMQQLGIPEHIQIWPMGHGQVINTVGTGTHAGCLFMVAVPDDIADRQAKYPDEADLLSHLLSNTAGQSSIIHFKDRTAVDNMIARLEELKAEMPFATLDEASKSDE